MAGADGVAFFDGSDLLTEQLQRFAGGDREIAETVLRRILAELHRIATRELSRERNFTPLTPTELINETWIRSLGEGRWSIVNRKHFYSIAARAMRRALVDFARKRLALRRNSGAEDVPFREEMMAYSTDLKEPERIALAGQLMEQLESIDPEAAQLVDLHYFAGYTLEEIAENCGLSLRQVRHRWSKAKTWLEKRLQV